MGRLIIKRNAGEAILAGDVEIVVLETHRGWVKLGVNAPPGTVVRRAELAPTPEAAPKRPK